MKNLLLVAALTLGFSAHAQLFVKPTTTDASYVFVNDTFIYVENDVELESNRTLANGTTEGIPNIALRNNAQLLQGEGTVSKINKGTGEISIFQEGTVNNFDYNVWGSPVGISRNGANSPAPDGNGVFSFKDGSSGFIESVFFLPTSVTISNPALGISGFDGVVSPNTLQIANYWLWSYKSGTNYGAWDHITNTGELDAGYGFTMKGVSGTDATEIATEIGQLQNNPGNAQRYDFRGRPNNGDINIEVGPTLDPSSPVQTLV